MAEGAIRPCPCANLRPSFYSSLISASRSTSLITVNLDAGLDEFANAGGPDHSTLGVDHGLLETDLHPDPIVDAEMPGNLHSHAVLTDVYGPADRDAGFFRPSVSHQHDMVEGSNSRRAPAIPPVLLSVRVVFFGRVAQGDRSCRRDDGAMLHARRMLCSDY